MYRVVAAVEIEEIPLDWSLSYHPEVRFHLPKILFSWKIPFFEKMLQEKWQNKAHIYIRQYVHIEIFENIDMKQVFIQK